MATAKPLGPITTMRAHLDTLEGVSLRIASWFMQKRPEELQIKDLTTGKIAAELGVSRAGVVRFCYKLGYASFAAFKTALLTELLNAADHTLPENLTCFPSGAQHVIEKTLPSLSLTLETLDPASFDKAVESLCRASMVIWFGCPGDSAYLAMSGEHKMTRSSLRARAVSDIRELEVLSRIVTAGDVVVVISQSGRWGYVASALPAFRERGCTIITITSQAHSLLARSADIVLLTAVRDITLGGEALGLRAAQLMVVDMLVMEAVHRLQTVPLEWCEPKATVIE